MKIAVVTDSTAYLNKEQVEKYNIRVVPIPFIIDDKVYNEGIDITTEEFYEKLRTCEKFPTTSQPPVGELVELYESLADEGYDTVISIHLAGTISGFIRTLETTVKDAVSRLVKTTDKVEPDAEIAAKYEQKYQTYRKLYPALKGIFPEL